MNDRIQIWAQEGRRGFVDALLRDRKNEKQWNLSKSIGGGERNEMSKMWFQKSIPLC